MRPKEIRTAGSVELKESVYTGRPIVYDQYSHPIYGQFRERIRPGAFDKWLATNPDIYACMYHDARYLLGRTSAGTLRMKPDGQGIAIEGDLPGTSYAADLRVLIDRKDIRGMSFIFTAVDDAWEQRDGQTFRDVIEAEIYEVCYLNDPAYPQTTAGMRGRDDYAAEIAKRIKPGRSLDFFKRRLSVYEMQ